jgi:peptidoglycan/xylan/chitin deacetylase (PgdA/CDA1 family)
MSTVLWTIDPNDWRSPPAEEVVDRVVEGLAPGAVVLLHDGGETAREGTVAAIPRLAYFLRDAAGYDVVDLTDALAAHGAAYTPLPE